jgi:hypothetical protein
MSEGKFLDKDDAKYLIDQFNKFASWGVSQPLQQVYSTLTLIVGCLAIITSLFVAILHLIPPPSVMGLIVVGFGIPTVIFILILVFLRRVSRLTEKVMDTHGRNIEKLTALMDYLSKCGSLPSDLTFERIVKSKPEDLGKLATSEEGRRSISEIDRLIAQISPMFLALVFSLGVFLYTNTKDQMMAILFSIGSCCFLISAYLSLRLYVTSEQTKDDWEHRRLSIFCFLYGIVSPVVMLIGMAYRAMVSLGRLDGYVLLLFLVLDGVLAYWGSGDLIKRIKHEI